MRLAVFVFMLAVICSMLYLIVDDLIYVWEVQQWLNMIN